VAGFIGMPQMNFYDARLEKENGKYAVVLEKAHIVLSDEKQANLTAHNVEPQDITLGVRPEHIALMGDGTNMIHGTVDVSEMMGSAVHLHLQACGRDTIIIVQTMDLQGPNKVDFSIGSPIAFTFGGNVAHMFSKTTEKNLEQ
jgi:multiple sugar transport system ATP-binding protein